MNYSKISADELLNFEKYSNFCSFDMDTFYKNPVFRTLKYYKMKINKTYYKDHIIVHSVILFLVNIPVNQVNIANPLLFGLVYHSNCKQIGFGQCDDNFSRKETTFVKMQGLSLDEQTALKDNSEEFKNFIPIAKSMFPVKIFFTSTPISDNATIYVSLARFCKNQLHVVSTLGTDAEEHFNAVGTTSERLIAHLHSFYDYYTQPLTKYKIY